MNTSSSPTAVIVFLATSTQVDWKINLFSVWQTERKTKFTMTILTKPNTGAKLCPKSPTPASVESGAIIEQVRVFFLSFFHPFYCFFFFFFVIIFVFLCRIPCCQQSCIAIRYQLAFDKFQSGDPITNQWINLRHLLQFLLNDILMST